MGSELTRQEKIEKQEQLISKIMWMPIFILLGIVPLIMKMIIIYPKDEKLVDILNTTEVIDIYSNFKATAITVLCVIMLVMLFLLFDKQKAKRDATIKWYLVGGGLFIGISLIATLLSKYPNTSWWGMPDRAEGFVVTACYLFMTGYTLYIFRTYRDYDYIIRVLSFLVIVSTIIGAFQYFGYDLFTQVKFIENLVLSKEAREAGASLGSSFESGKVFGTMFHYNYMGSFGAMMVPLFITLTLFLKDRKYRVVCGVMSLCSMFLLFGSTSRAGLIGLACSVLVGICIFAKKIIKIWKIVLPIMIGFIVILFGFNFMTGGTIFSRIPTLMSDITGLFGSSDESFDYRDHIPVRNIIHEGQKQKIVFQTGTLVLGHIDGEFYFEDEEGNIVDYIMDSSGTYMTEDPRFKDVTFKHVVVSGTSEQGIPNIINMSVNNLRTFYFMTSVTEGVVLCDPMPLQAIELEYPEAVGFKGKEKLGSARGYIWSRSIPMMKETLLVGYGPDTYALEFPQGDYLGKWWAYNTPNMIVDKAHNLYLAIFINQGGLALLGFLIMIGAYIVQSIRLYALKTDYEASDIKGIAVTLAIVGYLGAGIFNDSVISVAPIFWILLGTGMAINYYINKDREKTNKKVNKVIPLKR